MHAGSPRWTPFISQERYSNWPLGQGWAKFKESRRGRRERERAMAEHWQDLVEAHLAALGATPTLALSGWRMHLLLVPTFHRSCWLSFNDTEQALELELVVLQEEPIRSSRRDRLKPGKSRCWEDLVQVPEAQTSELRSLIATIDMARMETVELAARDGIFVQCWYSD